MPEKKYYIGEVEKLCNISKKTLRYYDQIGLLCPSEISEKNGYRFYSRSDLNKIPIIKYYKQSGFKLENIKKLMNKFTSPSISIEEKFNEKIKELEILEQELKFKKKAVEEWSTLIREARMVIDNELCNINIKFLEKSKMLFLEQKFDLDYESSIINVEFTNYVEKIKNIITGPVIIEFPSFEERCQGKCSTMKIIQKCLLECEEEKLIDFGGHLIASYYYIGSYSGIKKAYERVKNWLKLCNYEYEDSYYERYVVDYWTFNDEHKFVTELIIKLKENN